MEGQYYVNLWAALIGLEFGLPDGEEILQISGHKSVVEVCLDTVVNHYTHCKFAQQKTLSAKWIARMKTRYNIV